MNTGVHLDAEEREQIAHLVEITLTVLSALFLVLLLVEFAAPLSPAQSRWLELVGWFIGLVFAVDFVVRFALAEAKLRYLRHNWLTALALVLPAFRVFRLTRAVRAVRSLRLARLVTGTNRGTRALRRLSGVAGGGYVVLLTVVVWLLSAAGIVYLERGQSQANVTSFPEALWWSATTLIQQGSERHPVTAEGRVLAVLLMIFALAISGYITAALAAFLLGRRQDQAAAEAEAGRTRIPSYVPPPQTPADPVATHTGGTAQPHH